jgi:hypothetical protein
MELTYILAIVMAVVYSIPIGWLFMLLRNNNARVDKIQRSSYTKMETKEMIELHIKPVLQAVDNVKEDTTEIKKLIRELFNAQANKS